MEREEIGRNEREGERCGDGERETGETEGREMVRQREGPRYT